MGELGTRLTRDHEGQALANEHPEPWARPLNMQVGRDQAVAHVDLYIYFRVFVSRMVLSCSFNVLHLYMYIFIHTHLGLPCVQGV